MIRRWRCRAHDLSLLRGRSNSSALGRKRLRLQRSNIGGESENLLLRQLPLKGGHQGLIPGNNFGTGRQNRFADVSIIRGDGRAVCQDNLGSIKTAERWSAAGAIDNMTSDAGLFGEELFAVTDGT